MAEIPDEDYGKYRKLDDHEVDANIEWALTDLQLEGAIVSLQVIGPDTIRVAFGLPAQGTIAEAEVTDVESAGWWLCDQGVRHNPAFAREHALHMGADYAPASPKMRDYGCTCPDTPDVQETRTYIVYEKCPIHGWR